LGENSPNLVTLLVKHVEDGDGRQEKSTDGRNQA
jgi:hypothetical protein